MPVVRAPVFVGYATLVNGHAVVTPIRLDGCLHFYEVSAAMQVQSRVLDASPFILKSIPMALHGYCTAYSSHQTADSVVVRITVLFKNRCIIGIPSKMLHLGFAAYITIFNI